MRRIALAAALTLVTTPAWAQPVTQQTSGWCSPAVANVKGNVSIICQGVDPKALILLNEELAKKNVEYTQKLQEANEWAIKYRELSARLAATGDDNQLTKQANALIQEGKFDQAGSLLDRLLAKRGTQIDTIAENHFNRAELFSLQFRDAQALQHYEKAFQYHPNNAAYASALAIALHKQNYLVKAGEVYVVALQRYRDLAARNSDAAHRADVAATLNNLAMLHSDTERLADAEAAYKEALALLRNLAARGSDAYRAGLAGTLNNLATLYKHTQRLADAETAYKEALALYRDLAARNPDVYRPGIAMTLDNLALLYGKAQRLGDAEAACKEALALYRDLAARNPDVYQPDVAMTLNNLASHYTDTQQLANAEAAYKEALALYRHLAARNSDAHRPMVAMTLYNLALLYATQRLAGAETAYKEALALYRDLAAGNPDVYRPGIAKTLNNLAFLYRDTYRIADAEVACVEALRILGELEARHPGRHLEYVSGLSSLLSALRAMKR